MFLMKKVESIYLHLRIPSIIVKIFMEVEGQTLVAFVILLIISCLYIFLDATEVSCCFQGNTGNVGLTSCNLLRTEQCYHVWNKIYAKGLNFTFLFS